jgi:hypothetical protein
MNISIDYLFVQHPFFQGNLTSHIARDLLDRLHNGTTNRSMSEERDDDEEDDRVKE